MRSKNRNSVIRISQILAVGLLFAWPKAAWSQAVTATIPVGTTPKAVALNKVTNKIYVANYCGSLCTGNVTVIDGGTNSTATLQTGLHPVAVAVNETTNKVYVADYGNAVQFGSHRGGVIVIDGANNSTTTVIDPNAIAPRAIAVDSATNKIYVANFASGNVTVIDGATNSTTTVTDPNANGLAAYAVAVNPVTRKIYVANNNIDRPGTNPGNVTVIDGAINSTTTISDPNAFAPVAVAVNTVTNKIYVANMGDYPGTNHGNVTVIDGTTNSITTVTDPDALSPGGPDSGGFSVAINQTTNKIYVTNANDSALTGNGGVTVIDGATNTFTHVRDPNAIYPIAVAVDSATNTIYVANGGCGFLEGGCNNPGSVTAINGATNAAATVIDPNAGGPDAVAVKPLTNKIYVANGSSNVTVIDGGAIPTSHTLSVVLEGSGSGTVASNPTGINCGTSCIASFASGTAVSLTDSPASESSFSGWSTACTGTGSCDVTLTTSDEFVTANFNTGPPPDFSLQPASASLSTQRGGQVTDIITIAPMNGGSFANAILLSCAVAGSTPLATCALSSASVTPGANSVTSTLTITAPGLSAELLPSSRNQCSAPLYAFLLPMQGLVLLGLCVASSKRKPRPRHLWLLCSPFLAFVALQAGCGGGGSQQLTPPLNYTVTVTATSGAVQHTTQVSVTVP